MVPRKVKEANCMRKFTIVGMGLIGGSMAQALKGFEDFTITGTDISEDTLDYAREYGIADEVTPDASEAIRDADVVMLCQYPQGIIDFMHDFRDEFKPGCLVTDVCGVKTAIMQASRCLPKDIDFIGCHPMAGTEFSGISNSFPEMFEESHLILTPQDKNTEEHLELMERLGRYIGCQDVIRTTPEDHDRILAYTSQMMHIIALSVCDDENLFTCKGYEGTSFRGCTRVAALDVPLWTQLFSMNIPALTVCLDELIEHLQSYREVLRSGDRQALSAKLRFSSDRKRQVSLPGPDLLFDRALEIHNR